MAVQLAGQVALVTGGSGGIGRAICTALARAGAAVAVGYRTGAPAAAEAVAAIAAAGGRAVAVAGDVAEAEAAAGLVEQAVRSLGRLDILVNNAGVSLYRLLLDTAPEEWNRVMAVHLGGAYHCTRAALPHMLAAGSGRIVNISSIWGQVGAANEVAYSTAKAGLIGFTRALARELALSGITVNAVAPGVVETPMVTDQLEPAELAELAAQVPAGRLGRPEQVAAAVVYLCSPGAAYITGQVVGVSGGMVM